MTGPYPKAVDAQSRQQCIQMTTHTNRVMAAKYLIYIKVLAIYISFTLFYMHLSVSWEKYCTFVRTVCFYFTAPDNMKYMQRSNWMLTITLFILYTAACDAQSTNMLEFKGAPPYRNCAAVIINGVVCDDNYFVEGKPRIGQGMKGELTVASVSMSEEGTLPINNILFQVAIKNERTNTTWIYTKAPVSSVNLNDLLSKCEKGDYLIIMPSDQQYSLPKHKMWVAVGC